MKNELNLVVKIWRNFKMVPGNDMRLVQVMKGVFTIEANLSQVKELELLWRR